MNFIYMPQNDRHTILSRRLVAILFGDIVGYTAVMQVNEERGLMLLQRFKQEFKSKVSGNSGKIVQFYGDGCLAIFNSSCDALHCAKELQECFQTDPEIPVRIGLHAGDVVELEGNVFGDAVNIASRIESLGAPGSVLLSSAVRHHVKNKPGYRLESLGRFTFKNVINDMTLYALANKGFPVPDLDCRVNEKLSKQTKHRQ